jgi:hypothetical protein
MRRPYSHRRRCLPLVATLAFAHRSPSRSLVQIPLAFIDLFKQFKPLREAFPATNELARNVFALLFIVLRGIYW